VPLRISIFDEDGAPADPTSITLTITLPDGTTVTPAPTHPETGVYLLDYLPTVVGLHSVAWVATGVNATSPPLDSFHVEAANLPPIVSLTEARRYIGKRAVGAATDGDVAAVALVATSLAELVTGKSWRRRVVTETLTPVNGRVWTTWPNILSVTSVAGAAVDPVNVVADAGVIRTGYGSPVEVVYVTGPPGGVVPPTIREGVLEMIRALWPARANGPGASRTAPDPDGAYIAGYLIPYRVQQLWLLGEAGGIA
jgi:hypothetical protein